MTKQIASLVAGIIIGVVCLVLVAALVFFLSPRQWNFPFVTPVISVVPAPPIVASLTPELQPTVTPTLEDGVPPDPGNAIQAGITVRITGTGGDGLRLRREAGTTGTPIFLGADNEVFVVKGGPEAADGYTWWYLEAPYDASRAGWAVSNYLTPYVEE
jgi:hypothetical protein